MELQRHPDVGPTGWIYAPPRAEYGYGSARLWIAPAALTIRLHPETDGAIAALLALGPGLAGVLAGRVPLIHGTTLRTAHGDVILIGPSGVGKSTLAAAWIARGAQLVADDLGALDGDAIRVGFGRIKLWGSAGAVGRRLAGWAERSRVHPDHEKFSVAVPLVSEPRVLRRVLLLHRGHGIESVSGSEALLQLLANHRLPEILTPPMQRRWFKAISGLVQRAEVLRVGLPGPLDALDPVIGRLESLG